MILRNSKTAAKAGAAGGADPEIPNSRCPASRFGRETARGEGIPDSRLGRNRESGNPPFREIPRFGKSPVSGNPPFPDSAGKRESGPRLAANREIEGTLPVRVYSRHDPGLDVALSPSNADSWPQRLPHLKVPSES
jgi:hypothetical protein